MQHLPRANFENEGVDQPHVQRVISCLHPMKTIFLAVVTRPNEEQNFDGKMNIRHVNSQHIQERDSYHQNFHQNCYINALITYGGWRVLYTNENMNFYEFCALIQDTYYNNDDFAAFLSFHLLTHVGQNRRRKWVKMNKNEIIQTTNTRRTD